MLLRFSLYMLLFLLNSLVSGDVIDLLCFDLLCLIFKVERSMGQKLAES